MKKKPDRCVWGWDLGKRAGYTKCKNGCEKSRNEMVRKEHKREVGGLLRKNNAIMAYRNAGDNHEHHLKEVKAKKVTRKIHYNFVSKEDARPTREVMGRKKENEKSRR
jgi:hypothetical protein